MDLPASYYGELDKRNPVIAAFKRDINSFMSLIKQASRNQNNSYAKGIKILVEIWSKYKHRLPSKLYHEHMLQIADFAFGLKFYQLALWQGYSLYLLEFTSVNITDITDVDQFMVCFFPDGFDKDHDIFTMKIRALQGWILCVFEEEKKCCVLCQEGLCKLLSLLNFIRIMMQAFQQNEHFHLQIYDGSQNIFSICRYLMTMNCSAQALEYLLSASVSLELSIPLMTVKYMPLMVTIYCAVCHCYYDNQAGVLAEEFARRALGKVNELAKQDEHTEVSATDETKRAYKEASIKLGSMIFKRAVFEGRSRHKIMFRNIKDTPSAPWPRNPTERMLTDLFDGSAGQFLAILEALWDSTARPLQTRMPDDPELKEVTLELLSAGFYILSGGKDTNEQSGNSHQYICRSVLTESPVALIDLAISSNNTVPIMSAVRFIKLLFQFKLPKTFPELVKQMLEVLSNKSNPAFGKAMQELSLLYSFHNLSSQRSTSREDNLNNDGRKSSFSLSEELTGLVETLHESFCGPGLKFQADKNLVLDILLCLWNEIQMVIQKKQVLIAEFTNYLHNIDHYEDWILCLSLICEVAFACGLPTDDCEKMTEMIRTLIILVENVPEGLNQIQQEATCEADDGTESTLSFRVTGSYVQLLQKVCEVVERGREALGLGATTLFPSQDCSAVTDSAFMQKCNPRYSSATFMLSPASSASEEEKEMEFNIESDFKGTRQTQSTHVYLMAKDLYLELDILYHKASLKLVELKAVEEFQLLDRINKNKVSKALFFIQKALLWYNKDSSDRRQTASLLQEASTLIEKCGIQERKVYMTISSEDLKTAEHKDKGIKTELENPPPPPVLLSRSGHSFTFVPAPYTLKERVCWYQLCGRAADSVDKKVRLGDCRLPETGNMVPAVSGQCVLRAEGLKANQEYVFAVVAYDRHGKLLGNSIGGTTSPVLASMPLSLLSTWAYLAQVAFQTGQYAIAKRACRELWSHFTDHDSVSSMQDRLAVTGLHKKTLQCSSSHLCQLFFTSIFIETEINIQQGSLYCNSFGENGPFIWEKEARLAECERTLLALDLAMYLNNGSTAVQAVVCCYSLLAPLIFHQIFCPRVVEVLKKCLIVLEDESSLLKQKCTRKTSEAFMHMIACISLYLSKALCVFREHQVATDVLNCGRKLFQEVNEAQVQVRRLGNTAKGKNKAKTTDQAGMKVETKMSRKLRALHEEIRKITTSEESLPTANENSSPKSNSADSSTLYDLISTSPLNDAHQEVMKHKYELCFTEYAALLLQRTMEEGYPDLVLDWGQTILQFLSSCDEEMRRSMNLVMENKTKKKNSTKSSKENDSPQKQDLSPRSDLRKRLRQKLPRSMLRKDMTYREMQVAENLLMIMSYVVQHQKKKLLLRTLCSKQRVWKSHLNYIMAQAHLALLYQNLDQLHGGHLEQRYSHMNPLYFSLAYSGVLVGRNLQQQQKFSENEASSGRQSSLSDPSRVQHTKTKHKDKNKKKASQVDESVPGENLEDEEGSSEYVEQNVKIQRQTAALLLDPLSKVVMHLQRAMVLAHRGSHWTTLQYVCQTVWNQSCRITVLLQEAVQLGTASPITADQLDSLFTPLLVLAIDLIMDMLNRLGLWGLYDKDLSEDELESCLHFSAPLDDTTQIDLRWIRTLVLHTLERLHNSGKWESLAHFALLFNSYTRERYSLMVTPLLIIAQRRLLERIHFFNGPAVPQPHHFRTHMATGTEVTCRSYADCQLLSGWRPRSAHQAKGKKVSLSHITLRKAAEMKGAEKQLSMSRVCVPLDVADTLRCYHEALEKKPHSLQALQHGRALLVLLLENARPDFVRQSQFSLNSSLCHSASLLGSSPFIKSTHGIHSPDLREEDFSTPNAIYSFPIPPEHMPTVTAAYSTSIKYLQVNRHDSLRVLALHEMGNIHFYNGNMRAAHSSWSTAVDCALKDSGVVEKWDGVSFGGNSLQQTLKQAGIWGCLKAAVLTAKIAQYILTSDVSQRTSCCLLSAHLFKCILHCSMAHPQADLQYALYDIGDELLPGTDLFSEPHRLHAGTAVTSLNFICHWLFAAGYNITVLPLLSIHIHFVRNICRDVQRTIDSKILRVRVLTQLCLFTEAVKETVQLTQGRGVLLPHGQYISEANLQPVKIFYSDKPLCDNVEALEELVNCDFTAEVRTLYGPTLCLRFNVARVQLILALANSVCGLPAKVSNEGQTKEESVVDPKQQEQNIKDNEESQLNTDEPKVLTFGNEKDNLSPGNIKFLLLEGASVLLHSTSEQLTSHFSSEMENLELTIEFNLLKANLHLQQGHAALSCKVAVSSLVLLQTSPVMRRDEAPDFSKSDNDSSHSKAESERETKDCGVPKTPEGDCPKVVEASERVGASLWLRCRLALVHSLTADIPNTAPLLPGKNINVEAGKVLHDGIEECVKWGDHDTRALLMVEEAELEARRRRTDESLAKLQEAVSLLSGRTHMPPKSIITLARATLLLSGLSGLQSSRLLKLTQTLLRNQLSLFGQNVELVDGNVCLSTPGPSNIYLPYLKLLKETTLRIGHHLADDTKEKPVSPQSSPSTSRQSSQQSILPEGDSPASPSQGHSSNTQS